MKPSHFFQQYILHDSLVHEIQYYPEKQECVCKLELSNWMQPHYQEGDAEIILGELIFTGVEKLETNLDLAIFKENKEIDGQILETQLISSNEVDILETWKLVVVVSNYEKHSERILVIIIYCKDIQWKTVEQ